MKVIMANVTRLKKLMFLSIKAMSPKNAHPANILICGANFVTLNLNTVRDLTMGL